MLPGWTSVGAFGGALDWASTADTTHSKRQTDRIPIPPLLMIRGPGADRKTGGSPVIASWFPGRFRTGQVEDLPYRRSLADGCADQPIHACQKDRGHQPTQSGGHQRRGQVRPLEAILLQAFG